MMHIRSYPSVFAIGHKAIANLFDGVVLFEEKVDGSQISWQVSDEGLSIRSKNADIQSDAPEGMFARAVESIRERLGCFHPGWIYRGEYLLKPHHNTLKYSRVPNGNIILFDVEIGEQSYMGYEEKACEADLIKLECVPMLYKGVVSGVDQLMAFLDRESILGGTKIEGVVCKNYSQFTSEKKVAIGKYVSEKFKEVHTGEWRKANPTKRDIVDALIAKYRTEARWEKSVQHLRDAGTLEGSPRDIGALIREIPEDVLKECRDEIADSLFEHFWLHIRRGVIAGFPDYYKQKLAETAFNVKGDEDGQRV